MKGGIFKTTVSLLYRSSTSTKKNEITLKGTYQDVTCRPQQTLAIVHPNYQQHSYLYISQVQRCNQRKKSLLLETHFTTEMAYLADSLLLMQSHDPPDPKLLKTNK